jgi:signal peptidase I
MWVRDLTDSLAISAFIIIFLYQPVKVEGTSMMPGLEDQERIFVNKFVYRWEPIQRGDIVVFRYPRDTRRATSSA